MKQSIRIIVCASAMCLALIMASLTAASFKTGEAPDTNSAAAERADGGFVIMEHGGRIAVFASSDLDIPLTVTNIRVSSLRESDRLLLSSGLEVTDEAELAQLLEDFGS